MKKILLLSFAIGTFLFSNAQYPMTGVTTPTGQILDINGFNVGQAGCNSIDGGATSCPQICRGTIPATVTFAGPGLWNVYFEFYNPSNGNKHIRVEILCGATVLVDQCLDASGNSGLRFFKTYNLVPCTIINTLLVRLTPFTGNNCGGSSCGTVISSVGGGSLPVTFKSFTANRNHSNVLLKWETATEINNSGFAVERNTSGSWEQVAFVPSQAVNGSSDVSLSYQFTDMNNTKGVSQYRIKQVDLDAKSKYSEIRSVRGDGQLGKTIVYPNPSNDGKVNVVFEDNNASRDISVSDMSGRTVRQMKGVTNNNITIENLTPGMYSLRILIPSTGEQSVEKIVVNKR